MSAEAFTPTNRLEEALRAAALDPARMPAFYAALADESLLVAVSGPPGEDGQVQLPMLEIDGHRHVLVFTSETQLARAGNEGARRIELSGQALATRWPDGAWMAVNLDGDLGLPLAPEIVATLAGEPGCAGAVQIPAGAEVMLGEPAQEPTELLDALRSAATELPELAALHRALVLVRDGSGQPPFLVVGVELEPGAPDPGAVLDRLGEVTGERASLLLMDGESGDSIGGWMREQARPFFTR